MPSTLAASAPAPGPGLVPELRAPEPRELSAREPQELDRPVCGAGSSPAPTGARPAALARLDDLPIPPDPTEPFAPLGHDVLGDLPILAELPLLGSLLTDLRAIDRLIANVLDTLRALTDTHLTESVTGLDVDHWLRAVARRTNTDIRMLHTAAATLTRVPALDDAFHAGAISWAQLRTLALTIQRMPHHLDRHIDTAIGRALTYASADADPNDLLHVLAGHLVSLDPTPVTRTQEQARNDEYLAMQPRLDGTGGRFHGECGPLSWAVLDAALNSATSEDPVPRPDEASSGPVHRITRPAGRARLDRLVSLLDSAMTDPGVVTRTNGDDRTEDRDGSRGSMRSRPQLLLRADLTTLLDRDQTPASLLTTLLGGHVRLTADTLREIVDQRGADLRTVVLDDSGAVVGVGRRTRVAPAWLADTLLALHTTCTHPGCCASARTSDADHARPWHPHRPTDQPGRTDADQLAPLCPHHNHTKESDGWTVSQEPDGSRRWWHRRTGLTATTLPATWKPAGKPPDTS